MTSTRRRARASTRAALSPAGPAPTTTASNALPLNGDTHHGSPFRPRSVVVADRGVAEQLELFAGLAPDRARMREQLAELEPDRTAGVRFPLHAHHLAEFKLYRW